MSMLLPVMRKNRSPWWRACISLLFFLPQHVARAEGTSPERTRTEVDEAGGSEHLHFVSSADLHVNARDGDGGVGEVLAEPLKEPPISAESGGEASVPERSRDFLTDEKEGAVETERTPPQVPPPPPPPPAPLPSPSSSLSSSPLEGLGTKDDDVVAEDDDVDTGSRTSRGRHGTLDQIKRKEVLYSLTKSNAPSASGLIPGVLLGLYSLYLFSMKRYDPQTVKEIVLERFPLTPRAYLDVMLHSVTPFAFAGGSALLLSNYVYSLRKRNAYNKLLDRSYADKNLSAEEQSKALNELLVYHRDHREKPPIEGLWGLAIAALPFVAEKAGLLDMFEQSLGAPGKRAARIGSKVVAGGLALYGAHSLIKSLWKRRKYEQKKKELFSRAENYFVIRQGAGKKKKVPNGDSSTAAKEE